MVLLSVCGIKVEPPAYEFATLSKFKEIDSNFVNKPCSVCVEQSQLQI